MRFILAVLLAAFLCVGDALAGGPCSGVKGGCGRSSYRSSASSGFSGSVYVGGYTRKDGTYVRPHTRTAAGTAIDDGPRSAPLSYRTTARTTARTKAWNGTGSAYDDEEVATLAPPATIKKLPPKPKAPARYMVHFSSGRSQPIAGYEEVDGSYSIIGLTGGKTRYPKSMVARFEELPVEQAVEEDEPIDGEGSSSPDNAPQRDGSSLSDERSGSE